MPKGRFSQNIACQPKAASASEPSDGPSAMPKETMVESTPMAKPARSLGKTSPIKAKDRAMMIAPPSPCAARPAISKGSVVDTAHMIDASMKMANPQR
ncbi:hypothetical protein D3C78_1201660 [compost metagenome]